MTNFRDRLRQFAPRPVLAIKRDLQRRAHLARSLNQLARYGPAATAEEAYDMATEFRGWGDYSLIAPLQEKSEICSLIELLRREQVRCACEIGSFLGGILFMMTRLLAEDARLFSIDWPEAQEELRLPRSRKTFHEGFARARQTVKVIHGNSRDQETIDALASALGGEKLDFLFIDGDHSLEGAEADFLNYSGFVRPGGLIAFHDIIPHEVKQFGVPELWNRLRERYQTTEIVALETARRRCGAGIGVLVWNGER